MNAGFGVMKKVGLASLATLASTLLFGIGSAVAGPIGDTACTQPASSGFGTLVGCGTYIDTLGSNDGGGPLLIGGISYSQIAKYDVDTGIWSGTPGFNITGVPSDNGSWTSPFSVMFMVIKAGNVNSGGGFSVYGQGSLVSGSIGTVNSSLADVTALFSGATSGFWATAPTILNNSDVPRNLSHLSFYGRGTTSTPLKPLPAPGVLSLLGLGLLGLAATRRRINA